MHYILLKLDIILTSSTTDTIDGTLVFIVLFFFRIPIQRLFSPRSSLSFIVHRIHVQYIPFSRASLRFRFVERLPWLTMHSCSSFTHENCNNRILRCEGTKLDNIVSSYSLQRLRETFTKELIVDLNENEPRRIKLENSSIGFTYNSLFY